MTTSPTQNRLRGAEFLIKDSVPADIFIPEEFSEEALMVRDMTVDFLRTRVLPVFDQVEEQNPKGDHTITLRLLSEAAELGLLGTAIPTEYGGSAQDFITNTLLQEAMAEGRSFSLSQGAHVGIGTLPILYFGNESQKSQYLPKLVSGECKASYCLTEPGSGSDALAAKSKAVLNEAGTHYILNGQKMWITNAGFADVFIVFAKIDGEKFTGFIVERAFKGVSVGAEEKKLGIKGSSTRQVFFENVAVPVENVLGAIGKGHQIAFNILNIGRIKLASGVLGGSKMITEYAVKYANEREQFGRPIGTFGAIRHKIGEMAVKIYANESAVYRATADIKHSEEAALAEGKSLSDALLGAAEEYAIECAFLKVRATEALDFVADEALQIHGGMGYSEELQMAGAYRDARINRIFEGTNEINRMLVVDMLMKRAMSGKIDLMSAVMGMQKELMSPPNFGASLSDELLAAEVEAVKNMKKVGLLVAGATVQKLMMELAKEQEILMYISDIISDIYIAESTLLRTLKLIEMRGADACQNQIDMTQVFIGDAIDRTAYNAKHCLAAWAQGDEKRMLMMGVRRFTKYEIGNNKDARRRIAKTLLAANGYCF
jgi:alkylation response protein AidB-like acyl-CoA dehydrogenase